ncbi:hypothetical protein ABZ756_13920 [Mammaliicoccus sciuri]|uniref:Signal peptidase subunit (SPC12) n=2 Tax=Sporosarcina newyorkensis TaxID=759851 RepID=A0A1T4YTC1_9BACL|nr:MULTISPECIES: hypothetical protein [Sporosarcina]EGQ25997.1 hypothetical protein HMPREF9372_2012 [Sporosarcina newyorkensis 2681]MBY0223543.1 hypothetical protein [Sporosarcina aquimarina]SKB05039.1 signal peptidase subunit (SPC12) [Sporosarcina newyorkensis]
MYKLITLAIIAGIGIGTTAGFSLGSKEWAGMLAGVAALAFIVVPATVVYSAEKKKWQQTQ